MTVFISASEHYTGVNPAKSTMIKRIETYLKGYYETELNLNDFIRYNRLDMILNNELIRSGDFELYNYEAIYNNDYKNAAAELEDELKDINNSCNYLIDELSEYYGLDLDDIDGTKTDALDDYVCDNIYCSRDVYQWFIIPEYDAVNYWSKYTNYPIYYNDAAELYLLGITHFGMSWDYFSTTYKVRQYI